MTKKPFRDISQLTNGRIRGIENNPPEPIPKRLAAFRALANHAWHGRELARLKKSEREECEQFIIANDHLDSEKFQETLNRWKLDQLRTKNHSLMWGLVSAVAKASEEERPCHMCGKFVLRSKLFRGLCPHCQ